MSTETNDNLSRHAADSNSKSSNTDFAANPRVHFYQNLNHVELASMPRGRTVVFIPISPLEEHGPHLPFGVDAFMAEYFARAAAEQITARRSAEGSEWHAIILPPFFAGSDTLHFLGSIEVRQSAIRDLIFDCARKLAQDGFQRIVAVGGHGGPRHNVALEEVASYISWRHRPTRMVSATSKLLFDILDGKMTDSIADRMAQNGSSLSSEERLAFKTDYHAGMLETSIMMVIKPDLVKPHYIDLKPALLNSPWKIRKNSGQKIGGGLGHLGSPALARREIGEATISVLLDHIVPLLERFLDGDRRVEREFRSKFYYIPFFRTQFKYFAAVLAGFFILVGMTSFFMRFISQMNDLGR